MTPISICVIAKNEEKHMDTFLTSIQKHMKTYPYEIVMVDTGSTDKTVSIARKYTDKIYFFEWVDDFSAARNFSISCASNDWILVLDCDEYITELDEKAFPLMITNFPNEVGVITRRSHSDLNGADGILVDMVERFFNRKCYHYEEIIHEQVQAFDGHFYKRTKLPITVEHFGYNASKEKIDQKINQYNKLLFKRLQENPDDPYLYFQLGQSFDMIDDYENACYYYAKGLEYDVDPSAEYVQMMVIGYGYALLALKRYEEALLFQNIYDSFCSLADFVCLMGIIYYENGMVLKAMDEFLKATTAERFNVEGANSFLPTFNLARINERLGNMNLAIALYRKCGNYQPALDRLAELSADSL